MTTTADGTLGRSTYLDARGSLWSQQAKLGIFDPASEDQFGSAVAISGDTAIVGALMDDKPGTSNDCGTASAFKYNGSAWVLQKKLIASDAAKDDAFGYSVAISGSRAIVGAYRQGGGWGAAYVFKRSGGTWAQEAKLVSPEGWSFGYSVAISSDTVVVGEPEYGWDEGQTSEGDYYDIPGPGAAYVFTRSDTPAGSQWTQQARLSNWGDNAQRLGASVAISGDTAVLGTRPDDDDPRAMSEICYARVFVRNGSAWSQQAKLTASDAPGNDNRLACVSISGDTVILGAQGVDGAGTNSGAAYLFARSAPGSATWSQQAKLIAPDAAAGDAFGYSVSISGNSAIIGAYGAGPTNFGAAYLFARDGSTWNRGSKLTAPDAAQGDQFGYSVAIDGTRTLVGAPWNDGPEPDPGAAYVGSYIPAAARPQWNLYK